MKSGEEGAPSAGRGGFDVAIIDNTRELTLSEVGCLVCLSRQVGV